MNIEKLESDIQKLIANIDEETFPYDLLLAYGQPKASITRLKKGDYNLSKNIGEVLWKKNGQYFPPPFVILHLLPAILASINIEHRAHRYFASRCNFSPSRWAAVCGRQA